MPSPKPILINGHCYFCKYDVTTLARPTTCPECGNRFDPDFVYEGNASNKPEANTTPPPPRNLDSRKPGDD